MSREDLYRRALGVPDGAVPGTNGTFIHLDYGTLELGLVRDSRLQSANDFTIFAETFENVAKIASAMGLPPELIIGSGDGGDSA